MPPLNERQIREMERVEQVRRQAAALGYELITPRRGQYGLRRSVPHRPRGPTTVADGPWTDITVPYGSDSNRVDGNEPVYGTLKQVGAWLLDAEQETPEEAALREQEEAEDDKNQPV